MLWGRITLTYTSRRSQRLKLTSALVGRVRMFSRTVTVFARNGCALKMKLAMHGPSPRAQ